MAPVPERQDERPPSPPAASREHGGTGAQLRKSADDTTDPRAFSAVLNVEEALFARFYRQLCVMILLGNVPVLVRRPRTCLPELRTTGTCWCN